MTISKLNKTRPRKPNLKVKIITIDGPAGAGKSTVAKLLAKRLGYLYLDTGAMYRALTLAGLRQKVNFLEKKALIRVARKARIQLVKGARFSLDVYLDGKLINRQIRSPLVSSLVSFIASIGAIRQIMGKSQRAMGQKQNCVVEGRDIGTVIFPDAFVKFYLDASLGVRGKRRFKELKMRDPSVSCQDVKKSIQCRDRNDLTRSCGPLKRAHDAIYVDTTRLSISQVVARLQEKVLKKQSCSKKKKNKKTKKYS